MTLASYAASSETSPGRLHKEDTPSLRDEYQRDRDRVIHSSAFRRLEYKTQVFVNHEGDMFRTRLTHSIEVSQIGRTIARSLNVNEDLTEAICLAHDLGHTPFGHAGQDALNECMNLHGGFEHNLQSLRVVDLLEEKYAEFQGLNLTFETREGILKHCSRKNARKLGELGRRFIDGTNPGVEAQIANIADEIAYNNHDVDDGIRSGLISMEQLCDCVLFKQEFDHVKDVHGELTQSIYANEIKRGIINKMVTDLVETSKNRIKMNKIETIEDARLAQELVISLSDEMHKNHLELKSFLRKNLYQHKYVKSMTDNAMVIIKGLFESYTRDLSLLPGALLASKTDVSKYRIVSDYIAGMTDRFAISEYQRVTNTSFDPYN